MNRNWKKKYSTGAKTYKQKKATGREPVADHLNKLNYKMEEAQKKQIKTHLATYVKNAGSANRAATMLEVSGATISNILSDKWDSIADDLWRAIAADSGFVFQNNWKHADTSPYQQLAGVFTDAKQHSNVYGVVVHPGAGKTYTLDKFKAAYRNTYYVKCLRSTSERDFLTRLLKSMAKNRSGYRVSDMIDLVVNEAQKADKPTIIIDELERVKNKDVLWMFIDLYNELKYKCGFVLLGTSNLRDLIENGKNRGKINYNTFYSRVGGKFLELPAVSKKDVSAVITANGVLETEEQNRIINESCNQNGEYDLRRVERLVHAYKLQNL